MAKQSFRLTTLIKHGTTSSTLEKALSPMGKYRASLRDPQQAPG